MWCKKIEILCCQQRPSVEVIFLHQQMDNNYKMVCICTIVLNNPK